MKKYVVFMVFAFALIIEQFAIVKYELRQVRAELEVQKLIISMHREDLDRIAKLIKKEGPCLK